MGPNRFGPDPLADERGKEVFRNPGAYAVMNGEPRQKPDPAPMANGSATLLGMGHNVPPIVLDPGIEVTVGRSRQATVVLNDRFVSSLHLALRADERGEVTVRDLGSTNGTFLQGKRLTPNQTYTMRSGDRLEIGSKSIVYTL
jgi:hypothetical protein